MYLLINANQLVSQYLAKYQLEYLDQDASTSQARLREMLELIVRAFDSRQIPALTQKPLKDLFAVHANCTYMVGISNTKIYLC